MLAHFGGFYNGFYSDNRLGVFVNAVSIFFVVSGFGIYHTLEKNFTRYGINYRTVFSFFVRRYAKILPIYWLALALYIYIEPEWYSLDGFSLMTIDKLFLIPLKPAPGIMWFFTSLFHCYLWAPFLYLVIRKLQPRSFLMTLLGVMMLFLPVSYWFVNLHNEYLPYMYEYFYRDFFLANILIFALGMLIPPLIASYPGKFRNGYAALVSLAGYLLFAVLTRFPSDQSFKTIPFMLFNFSLCLYAVSIRPPLPFSRFVGLLGKYSLTLFLFHSAYFELLKYLGILRIHYLMGALMTLLFFPVFIACCIIIQKFFMRGYRAFISWYESNFGVRRVATD